MTFAIGGIYLVGAAVTWWGLTALKSSFIESVGEESERLFHVVRIVCAIFWPILWMISLGLRIKAAFLGGIMQKEIWIKKYFSPNGTFYGDKTFISKKEAEEYKELWPFESEAEQFVPYPHVKAWHWAVVIIAVAISWAAFAYMGFETGREWGKLEASYIEGYGISE